MYLLFDDISAAIEQISAIHPFFGITFLTCKRAKLVVGSSMEYDINGNNTAFLNGQHKLCPASAFFFTPYKSNSKTKQWIRSDYSSSGLQAINTQTFGAAFIHESNTHDWGWDNGYVDVLKRKLNGKLIPAYYLAVWLLKYENFSVSVTGQDLVDRFFKEYNIDALEQNELFDKTIPTNAQGKLTLCSDTVKWDDFKGILDTPPDLLTKQQKSDHYSAVQKNQTVSKLVFKTGTNYPFERNRIVFGAPGTGKSFMIEKDRMKLLSANPDCYERVTFHPEYTYYNFVGSYKPVSDPTDKDKIYYMFQPGPFMRVLVDAYRSGKSGSPQPYLLIVEEINRAKVAGVFGEIFQLLDRDSDGVSEYAVHTSEDIRKYLCDSLGGQPEDYTEIRLPDNMYIWATMNSADQGVFPVDTAFKRRWSFEYVGIDDDDALVDGNIELGKIPDNIVVNWNTFRKAINERLSEIHVNEDKLIGPYFLPEKYFAYDSSGNIIDPDLFKKAFKSKVLMYLFEDAGKQHRQDLFAGCDSSRYSKICDAFEEKGIKIFGDDFYRIYQKSK